MVAVLDACDVDGGAFEVFESDLKYAVRLGSVVDLSTIRLDHNHAAGRFFDDVIYACDAEDVIYGVLVHQVYRLGCGLKLGMALTW